MYIINNINNDNNNRLYERIVRTLSRMNAQKKENTQLSETKKVLQMCKKYMG